VGIQYSLHVWKLLLFDLEIKKFPGESQKRIKSLTLYPKSVRSCQLTG